MSSKSAIPVVDVDQAFPTMVGATSGSTAVAPFDQGPTVRAAIRDVLGMRSRVQDPKAFTDALTAAFRLSRFEGHITSEFVPRGYAVQADLGAVTGGQASLYRRATLARTEILRILDGLTPLRVDGDLQDMDAYRTIVRNAVQNLVDELGAPGGPRVTMVDSYLAGLLGTSPDRDPDTIGGQLGALRDRFGLVDDNVNTIEEEGLRTAYWTLVDMVRDLKVSWGSQRDHFTGGSGAGFLGTELILISRLMEAAADQVDELELVLDSVLISQSERQTIMLHDESNLTLDGLLSWLRTFLAEEGRHLAQDAGRDGIVSALAPTAVALAETFQHALADPIVPGNAIEGLVPVRYLRAGCCRSWPPGMRSARVAIAVSSLCRLLMELARRAQRIGRWAGVVVIDVAISHVRHNIDAKNPPLGGVVNVEVRGLNLRRHFIPAFVGRRAREQGEEHCRAEELDLRDLVRPLELSATADGESVSALFAVNELRPILSEAQIFEIPDEGLVFPASDVPVALIDSETAQVVHAPWPRSWPRLVRADHPNPPKGDIDKEVRIARVDGLRAPVVEDYRFRDPVGRSIESINDPDESARPDGVASDVSSLVDHLVEQLVARLDREQRFQVGPRTAVKTPVQTPVPTPAAKKAPAKKTPAKKAPAKKQGGQ
ncbi:hypothetical protein ABLE68_16365 [Nocardioides sp. CN2-186]|uniref:hypothetical protein n=1 Tax=Nocardioides tweenelious TaxID=3156607 RepID=UPI0032B44719